MEKTDNKYIVQFSPYTLGVQYVGKINFTRNMKSCFKCNNEFKIKISIRMITKLIGRECRHCRWGDRPFESTRMNRYEKCECMYTEEVEEDVIHYTCDTCNDEYLNPKCKKCKKEPISKEINFNNPINNNCDKCNKKEFNQKWLNMTTEDKLNEYGLTKLKKLAKLKQLKKYSKLNKGELIKLLVSITNNKDFPIK